MATLTDAKRVVIKIGSALLVDANSGALRVDWLAGLAADISWLKAQGKDVVLVSSGAIALGRGGLGMPRSELALEQSQAAAAVGQIRLARAYEEILTPYNIITAQVLVTLEDTEDRRRYLNARATLEQLLSLGAVPIVNENDTVATDEIRFGDNDRLAAQIAATISADVLVLLSDVDGLYTANPNINSDAQHIEMVSKITHEIEDMAGGAASHLSKGGMKTKIMAAKTATQAGCAMAITQGDVNRPLKALADGARATWFTASIDPHAARKRWIAAMKPRGAVQVDDGAKSALLNGNSLLPAGVKLASGAFGRGEPVAVQDINGTQIGQGLSRYTHDEINILKGHHSSEISRLLGYPGRAALIHRDDMAL